MKVEVNFEFIDLLLDLYLYHGKYKSAGMDIIRRNLKRFEVKDTTWKKAFFKLKKKIFHWDCLDEEDYMLHRSYLERVYKEIEREVRK
jgi:hypothetical protein